MHLRIHLSLLIKLIDILHSPVDVGAGDDGSEDRKDCGSLLQPVLFGLVGDGKFLVSHVSASPRGLYCIGVGIMYLTASVSEEWYSRLIPAWTRGGLSDSCVDPAGDDLGGDEAGVLYNGAVVIISRKQSS